MQICINAFVNSACVLLEPVERGKATSAGSLATHLNNDFSFLFYLGKIIAKSRKKSKKNSINGNFFAKVPEIHVIRKRECS